MLLQTKALSGGRTFSTFVTNLEGLPNARLEMVLLFFFWLDVWNDLLLHEKLPRLFTFAKNQKISVADFLSTTDLASHFHLPLSEQAYEEYHEL
jgi:hypothetical protein